MTDSQPTVEALARRGAGWKLASQLVAQSSRFVFAFVLAHLLTPREWGLAGMALLVTGLVTIFSDLALGAALVQRPSVTEADRSTVFWTSLAVGGLLTVVGVACSPLVAEFFGEPQVQGLFAVMSLGFVIAAVGATQKALLTREMSFRNLELRVMLGTLVGGVIGVVAAALGAGPWAIILQQLAILVVSSLVLWFAIAWRPSLAFSTASLRDLGGYSLSILGTRVLLYAREGTSTIVIGRFLGAAALGIWTMAYNLVRLPAAAIAQPLGEVLFPAFSRLQDDRVRMATLWLRALPMMAAVCMPVLVGFAIVADEFVRVALGEQWLAVVPVIRILAAVGILSCLDAWNPGILMAVDKPRALLVVSLLSTAVSLAAVVVGLPWGVNGIAVATLVVAVAFQAPYFWYVGRQIDVRAGAVARSLVGVTAATAGMGVVVMVARIALVAYDVPPLARLALLAPLGAATLLVMLRICERPVLDEFLVIARRRRGVVDAAGTTA